MKLSDKAKESLQKVVAQFEAGDLSPIVKIVMIPRLPEDAMPSVKWSLPNRVMAYMQCGQLDARGFRQWEHVGRKVRKGGRGIFILGPSTAKTKDKKTGEERLAVVGFHTVPVFPLSETEGDALPAVDYTPRQMPPLVDVAQRLGVKVEYASMEEEGHAGFYVPKHDSILLGTHDRSVFWHELAHAAYSRVESPTKAKGADEEVVAEFVACVLAALYGQDDTGNAWRYIRQYAEDPLTAIHKALADVEKVLAILLEEEVVPA